MLSLVLFAAPPPFGSEFSPKSSVPCFVFFAACKRERKKEGGVKQKGKRTEEVDVIFFLCPSADSHPSLEFIT